MIATPFFAQFIAIIVDRMQCRWQPPTAPIRELVKACKLSADCIPLTSNIELLHEMADEVLSVLKEIEIDFYYEPAEPIFTSSFGNDLFGHLIISLANFLESHLQVFVPKDYAYSPPSCTETTCCADSAQLIEKLLMIGGVEPNPGPRGHPPKVIRKPKYVYRPRVQHPRSFQRDTSGPVRLTSAQAAVLLNGSGILAATTYSSSTVTSLSLEWADYTPRWQNYVVEELIFHYDARFPINSGMGLNTSHSVMFASDWSGTNLPATLANIKADLKMKSYGTWKSFTKRVKAASKGLSARIRNPTNAAMPGANAIGIAIATSDIVNYLPVSVAVGQYWLEYIVHFFDKQ